MSTEPALQDRRRWLHSTVLAAMILSVLALAVRLPQLNHRVFVDELLHVLAARSFVETGTLQINDGAPYTRARLFTYMIAGLFRVFGENLVVSRIPALIAGVALVLVLFLWVRAVASPMAAWTAAVLLCLNPEAIYLSQWCRFYTLQSLFLLLGTITTYALVHQAIALRTKRWLALGVPICLALAMHLQVLSVVGIMALTTWVALAAWPALLTALRRPRAMWLVLGASLLVVAAAILIESGFVRYAWRMFQYAAPWADSSRDDYLFYGRNLLGKYATLCTLFPLAFLLAASVYRRPAWFCGWLLGTGLLIQSLAAWKSNRYLFWAMPYFFAVIGMAFDPAVRWIHDRVQAGLAGDLGRLFHPKVVRTAITGVLSLALVSGAAVGNRAFVETHTLVTDPDSDRSPFRPEPDWDAAAPALREVAATAETVLSSSGPKSLFFLQRLDFLLDWGAGDDGEAQSGSSSNLGFFRLLGVPVVHTPDSLARVIACHATGLVVIERNHSGRKVPAEVVEYLSEHTRELSLSREWRLLAFRWDHVPARPGTDCELVSVKQRP